jgi:hypothetical protein
MAPFPSYPQVIADGAVDLTPGSPEFAQSFQDTVGDAGTDTDGFETIFSALTDYSNTGPAVLSEMDSHLTELDGQAPGLGVAIEAEAVQAHTDAITTGQPHIDAFNASNPGDRGRVFPGAVMSWLGAQNGQEFGPIANIDQNPLTPQLFQQAGIFLPPRVGDPPFPTKFWIRTKTGQTPLTVKRVVLLSDNPVIERVWYDDLNSATPGADWHFYVDINPVQVGVFCGTVRLFQDDTNYKFMTLQVVVVNNYGDHVAPYGCVPDAGGAPTPGPPAPPAPPPAPPIGPPGPRPLPGLPGTPHTF